MSDSKNKDKLKVEFNPITGKFDLVRVFNPNRIITHENNAAGYPLMTYDGRSGQHIAMDPLIVTDEDGNVVVTEG
jgi:hypothetical protein